MSVIDESFINGAVSFFSSKLIDLSIINSVSSFESLLKVLNHSPYYLLSSKLSRGDVIGAENLFFNELFGIIDYFKVFSSKRLGLLLEFLFDYWFGYYSSIADFKNVSSPFPFKSSVFVSDELRYAFLIGVSDWLMRLKGLFSDGDFSSICSFVNYRLNGGSFSVNGLSVVNELLFFLFKKEFEIKSLLRVIKSLWW